MACSFGDADLQNKKFKLYSIYLDLSAVRSYIGAPIVGSYT